MKTIQPLAKLDLNSIETLVFAGGGNRCWWQAGVMSHLLHEGWQLPSLLVGTSAGAAIAASCITESPKAALNACVGLFARNTRIFDWKSLARLQLRFAHQYTYPAWIESFVNAGNFEKLCVFKTRLRVAITRPAKLLGVTASIVAGTIAYIIDKHIWNSIHPRLPKLLGLRQDFIDLHDCHTIADAQTLLRAAAAAPPFMSSRMVGSALAFDGGYTDNAPIHAQTSEERLKTLVLLTRHYKHLPQLFAWRGRTYWQPSQRVPVSTWDCTERATVSDAFALGERDAIVYLQGNRL